MLSAASLVSVFRLTVLRWVTPVINSFCNHLLGMQQCSSTNICYSLAQADNDPLCFHVDQALALPLISHLYETHLVGVT